MEIVMGVGRVKCSFTDVGACVTDLIMDPTVVVAAPATVETPKSANKKRKTTADGTEDKAPRPMRYSSVVDAMYDMLVRYCHEDMDDASYFEALLDLHHQHFDERADPPNTHARTHYMILYKALKVARETKKKGGNLEDLLEEVKREVKQEEEVITNPYMLMFREIKEAMVAKRGVTASSV